MMGEFTGLAGVSALVFVLAFLMGSVPFGLLLTQAFSAHDLRQIGSGNIGATNVLRTGNKSLALATLLLDAGKAALAVIMVQRFALMGPVEPWWPALAGLAACLGHCYSPWLNFQGGKAVACFLGVWLCLVPLTGWAPCLVWLVVALIWRRSSLASMSAAFSAPFLVWGDWPIFALMALLSAVIWWRHRGNLARLINGSEPKIGASA